MASGLERFDPIPDWSRSDNSAIPYGPSEPPYSTGSGESYGDSGVAARANHPTYRFRVAIASGICFAIGTGFSIYNLALGR